MTNEELTKLTDGDRVVVRYRGHEITGALDGAPDIQDGPGEAWVTVDAGLGDNGEGQPMFFDADDVVRRADKGEGLVRIGGQFHRQADTIFAEGT